MKAKLKIIVSASVASILAFAASAEHTPNHKSDGLDSNHRHLSRPLADRLNGAAKASDLIGMTVKNYQDEKLGKVEEIAVDVESGRVVQVILSSGGLIGIADTLTAVPPGALHHDVAQKILHLDVDKARLKAAPKFETAKWDEGTQSNRLYTVYAYYGQEPYFVATRNEAGLSSVELKEAAALPRNLDGTINTDGPKTVEKVRNEEIARNLNENYDSKSTRNPDGTWSRAYHPNGRAPNSDCSLGYVQKASKVIGTPVKNLQDEKLGDVNNIMVDLASGRIVAVIISAGGFLGMGDELSAIPPTALRYTPDHESLQLDTTKEALSRAPHFKSNQWPDFNQPTYASGVYRAYNVQPYFASDSSSDADLTRRQVRDRDDRAARSNQPDNTARNVRDRDEQTLTPLDQGTSKADVNTTAQIRKEIIAAENISVNARNVKVITREGRVTLRGPVNTAEEKSLIGDIANRIARSENVDNQLEVKFRTTSN